MRLARLHCFEAMEAYHIRSDLHWCAVGRHLIFLDLTTGRYFSIPTEWNATVHLATAGLPIEPDHPILKKLLGVGILAPSTPAMTIANIVLPAANDELRLPHASRWPLYSCLECLWYQWQVSRTLSWRGLAPLIECLRAIPQPPPERRAKSPADYRHVVRAFSATTLLFTHADRCLARSIALLLMIRKSDPEARLVIGVAASPFSAHAWLQRGPTVLNDCLDKVRAFTPILVA